MDTLLSNNQRITQSEIDVLLPFCEDYRRSIHVREISRLLSMNHRTVSLALKRLEAKGVVKHIKIGKSKVYSLDLFNPISRFYIATAESTRTLLLMESHFLFKKMLTELSEEELYSSPMLIFGSFAKDETDMYSDVDILILSDKKNKSLEKKVNEFFQRHRRKCHILSFSKTTFLGMLKRRDPLANEISKHHLILNHVSLFVSLFRRNGYEKVF